MTQDEMQRLLIRIIDEVNWIMWYQELLKIAHDQLENPDNRTVDRIELLLSSYLDQTEPYFHNLKWHISRRDETENSYLSGD